jgi:hypothetical protein
MSFEDNTHSAVSTDESTSTECFNRQIPSSSSTPGQSQCTPKRGHAYGHIHKKPKSHKKDKKWKKHEGKTTGEHSHSNHSSYTTSEEDSRDGKRRLTHKSSSSKKKKVKGDDNNSQAIIVTTPLSGKGYDNSSGSYESYESTSSDNDHGFYSTSRPLGDYYEKLAQDGGGGAYSFMNSSSSLSKEVSTSKSPSLMSIVDYRKLQSNGTNFTAASSTTTLNMPTLRKVENGPFGASSTIGNTTTSKSNLTRVMGNTLKVNLPSLVSRDRYISMSKGKDHSNTSLYGSSSSSLSSQEKKKSITWDLKDHLSANNPHLSVFNTMMSSTSSKMQSLDTAIANSATLNCHHHGECSYENLDKALDYISTRESSYLDLLTKYKLLAKIRARREHGAIIIIPNKKTLTAMLNRANNMTDKRLLKNLILFPNHNGTFQSLKGDNALTLLKLEHGWRYKSFIVDRRKEAPNCVLFITNDPDNYEGWESEEEGAIQFLTKVPMSPLTTSSSFNLNGNGSGTASSLSSKVVQPQQICLKQYSLLNMYSKFQEKHTELNMNDCCQHDLVLNLNKKSGEYEMKRDAPSLTLKDFTSTIFELSTPASKNGEKCNSFVFNMKQMKGKGTSQFVLTSSSNKPIATLTFDDVKNGGELSTIKMNHHHHHHEDDDDEDDIHYYNPFDAEFAVYQADSPTMFQFVKMASSSSSMSQFTNDMLSFDVSIGKFFKTNILGKKKVHILERIANNITIDTSDLSDISREKKSYTLRIEYAPLSKGDILLRKSKTLVKATSMKPKQSINHDKHTFKILYDGFPPISSETMSDTLSPDGKTEFGLNVNLSFPMGKKTLKNESKSIALQFSKTAKRHLEKCTDSCIFKAKGAIPTETIYLMFTSGSLTSILYTNLLASAIEKKSGGGDGTASKKTTTTTTTTTSSGVTNAEIQIAKFVSSEIKKLYDINNSQFEDLFECRMNTITSHLTAHGQTNDTYHFESQSLGFFKTMLNTAMTLADKDNIKLSQIKEYPLQSISEFEKVSMKTFLQPDQKILNSAVDMLYQYGKSTGSEGGGSGVTTSNTMTTKMTSSQESKNRKIINSILMHLKYDQCEKTKKTICLKAMNIIASSFMKGLYTINTFNKKESLSKPKFESMLAEVTYNQKIRSEGHVMYQRQWDLCSY